MTLVTALTTFRTDRSRPPESHRSNVLGCRATKFAQPTLHYQDLLFFVPVLLFSVIAHEIAHGYAALKQGDTTALMMGRLTWNPVKHIDLFMTILLPAMLFFSTGGRLALGGAKPVPVNPANYRNRKRGDIIVSLAGVFVNLLIAIAAVVLFVIVGLLGRVAPPAATPLAFIQAMMLWAVELNLLLLAFNLIPIPPLDGSHVLKYVLPAKWAGYYQRIGPLGIVILIFLLWSGGGLLNAWMRPALAFGELLRRWADPFALDALRQWGR